MGYDSEAEPFFATNNCRKSYIFAKAFGPTAPTTKESLTRHRDQPVTLPSNYKTYNSLDTMVACPTFILAWRRARHPWG